ncbi:uncharacterized protein TM35_000034450 [Trypanosoma theileri]|uniref:Uncharacterized protein n=1 Tax=Trypanosoma theileri TaxID=67003 RepID=A0A1X0P6Y6_9TRYP|nr:uncharacterized protein TM35_000034450 [Trypanosoma theileri]ORC92692.1 hypothetical protein TM35_000034450 [Trypanosoma theileri]
MGNRRIGGNSRVLRKKKLKVSKRSTTLGGASTASRVATASTAVTAGGFTVKKTGLRLKKSGSRAAAEKKRLAALRALQKERSQLLKRQAAERMVLKEHTRDLEARRQRIRKGENAKTERRELGKYIRQLREEQTSKHESELRAIEEAIKIQDSTKRCNTKRVEEDWEDIEDDDVDEIDENELQDMFAHLTT